MVPIYGNDNDNELNLYGFSSDPIDAIYGYGGNDRLQYALILDGGAGSDFIRDGDGDALILGGDGDDLIIDSNGNDVIDAGAGNDSIVLGISQGESNSIALGTGDDDVYFLVDEYHAPAAIEGGSGVDTLNLATYWSETDLGVMDFRQLSTGQSVSLYGMQFSGFERVTLVGTTRLDTVQFGDGDDRFEGPTGTVYGNGGNDIFFNRGGFVRFHGGDGNDVLFVDGGTSANPNFAFGDAGDDIIFSRYKYADYGSNSQLTGGSGRDGFVAIGFRAQNGFGQTAQADTILDFEPGLDWIGLAVGAEWQFVPGETRPIPLPKYNITDTVALLSFEIDGYLSGILDTPGRARVTYDKVTGGVWINYDSADPANGEMIFTVAGAPALTAADFMSLAKQTGEKSEADVISGTEGADILLGSENPEDGGAFSDVLYGYGGNDELHGGIGNDRLFGGAGDDILSGYNGADLLDGGAGYDIVWYRDSPPSRQGVIADLQNASLNAGLAATGDTYVGIEGLWGTSNNDDLRGDAGNNALVGDEGADVLSGRGGDDILDGGKDIDTMDGGAGNDIYYVDNRSDVVTELAGEGADDRVFATVNYRLSVGAQIEYLAARYIDSGSSLNLVGSTFDQTLVGNAGANILLGGGGADVMRGLGGNDTYYVDSADDVVIEVGADANDIVRTTVDLNVNTATTRIETIYVTGSNDVTIRGNSLDNTIYAGSGDAYVTALGGNDKVVGGAGSDLIYGGAGDDDLSGGAGEDRIRGDDGNDALSGGAGSDTLAGLAGNDTLDGGLGADVLNGGAGLDRATYISATAGVKATLTTPSQNTGQAAGDTYNSIEYLTGSNFNDSLQGNAEANRISGANGNDIMNGMAGDDVIFGGSGNDRIYGHLGNDTLEGNAGQDTFVFHQTLGPTNIDAISDFSVADDTIELENGIFTALTATGALSANLFKDIAVSAKDADDRIIYNSATGILYYDADGSGTAFGNVKFAVLDGKPMLTAADFVVI